MKKPKSKPDHPWSRLPEETTAAYSAFCQYRDLGSRRSLEAVRAADRDRPEAGPAKPTPLSTLKEWSSKFDFVERCRLYDNHLQSERDAVALADARRWEERRLAEVEKVWDLGQNLRKLVEIGLKTPMFTRTVEVRKDPDGHVVEHVTIEPSRWSFRDLAFVGELSVKLCAAALAAVSKDPAMMSDAELEAIAGAGIGRVDPH